MEDKIKDLLSSCSEIDFGPVNLSEGEKEFCNELHDEVISLCECLPKATEADARKFFKKYFRIPGNQELSFFSNYYAPAWSIIYWRIQSTTGGNVLKQKDKKNAKKAHSMALLLHPLDDHLSDGQLPVTYLALLLRSEAWMIMNAALKRLADGVDGGEKIIQGFIDDYYSSNRSSNEILSLESYCNHFRKQMATWLIVPVLMTKKMTKNEESTLAIQSAYESFGIAWRLLDDINDIQIDMMTGAHSSIYTCLPKDIKIHWDSRTEDKRESYHKIILDYIVGNSVVESIKDRICAELDSAASIVADHDMTGLASELRCLSSPIRNGQKNL